MPRRSMTRRSVARPQRRKFVWVRHLLNSSGADVATGSDLLSQFETDYGAQLIGATIVRIRGLMYANADSGQGTTNTFRFGARVLSGALDLSGPTPDQSPFVDENADWMLWEPFIQSVTTTAAGGEDQQVGLMRMIDVKSSRRLDELGERLVMFQASNPAAPTVVWSYGWDLSIGVKLP